jgi:type II secretory pathway pseudopilin PulG
MSRPRYEEGYTLIEILAGLAIGTVIAGVLVYATLFEIEAFGEIRAQNEVNASVQFVDQVLQRDLQNLKTVAKDPNYPDGTAIVGTDTDDDTVSIRLEDASSAPKIGSTPMVGFIVSITPNKPNAQTQTSYIRGAETTFADSTLQVVGSSSGTQALVSLHLAAKYIGPSLNQSTTWFVIDTSYTVGGGY